MPAIPLSSSLRNLASVSLSAITPSKSNTMSCFNSRPREKNTFVTPENHLYITAENGYGRREAGHLTEH